MPFPTWKLAEPAEGVSLLAESEGVWLRNKTGSLTDPRVLAELVPRSRLGQLLPTLISQLLELGIATEREGSLRIEYGEYAGLEQQEIDAFSGIVEWAPFTLELSSSGSLGLESFRYNYRFYLGAQIVYPERVGCFVRRADTLFQLDCQAFTLINTIDQFNALPPEKKRSAEAYVKFAAIKGLAKGVGAEVDRFITKQNVLIPSQVGVDMQVHDDGKVSFIPKFDGVDESALLQAFFQRDDIDEVFSFHPAGGGGVHLVLDDTQRDALRRMHRVRRLGGVERNQVLRDPQAVFDGIGSVIDLADFGPRVRGVGDFPFVSQPFLQRSPTGIFEDPTSLGKDREQHAFNAGIDFRYADGNSEKFLFNSREELLSFSKAARARWIAGEGTVQLGDKSILIDEMLVNGLDELIARVTPRPRQTSDEVSGRKRYLLIYTNESELEYRESYEGPGGESDLTIPSALKDPSLLKPHQRAGVAWLQRTFRLNRHGCLLADDMGLGKTLQVLTFLAWVIEQGYLSSPDTDPDSGPWKPILVVAPIILLENETWLNDMRTFFKDEGAVFMPWVTLRGATLSGLKRANQQETVIGSPILDLDRLLQYRVILTNYETIVNYQHSFAKLKDNLTVVVTDEAQEHKTPSTKISHALKSLSPRFRIACTGTPVETRLLDVWNIFDYLQPGQLLGSASEFRDQFEKEAETVEELSSSKVLDRLKDRLRYSAPDAFLLRRDKAELVGLPHKHEHQIYCDLSDKQREWHLDLVNRVKQGGEENHPFGLIHYLMRVYQHPALVPQYSPIAPKEAIESCPKLSAVIGTLRDIQRKQEKVLIFTRSLDMQQLLASVIGAEFDLTVDIVNGATNRRSSSTSAQGARRSIVSRFRESLGFNVLILSPDVAGIGLTLVEANHVIHYGRWWNPAKEMQATDRVYRIGQTKDVHVYYPICRERTGAFETFDEKLDALITRRKSLAKNFLAPMPSDGQLERELLDQVLSSVPPISTDPIPRITSEEINRMTRDRFEALVALLETKKGRNVILTPRSGDGGIDVVSISGREILLIRCVHGLRSEVEEGAVNETVIGVDGYRQKFSSLPNISLVPMLASSQEYGANVRRVAETKSVSLLSLEGIQSEIQQHRCSLGEVEAMESQRAQSMTEAQELIRNFL
jgi:hypothetical protein